MLRSKSPFEDGPTLAFAGVALVFAMAIGLGNAADFRVFYTTAYHLRTLGWNSVYDVHGITPYHYHPFTAWLLLPWTLLPFTLAKWAWALFNGWLLWDSQRLAKRYFQVPAATVLTALAFCVYPLTWQMKFANTSVFLVWGLLVALTTPRRWLSDALISLLILIKLTLVGWIPLLLITGHSRRVGRLLIWIAGASLLVWAVAGTAVYESWWQTLTDPVNAHNHTKNDNQSWFALTHRFEFFWNWSLAFVLGSAGFGLAFLKQVWPLRRQEASLLMWAAVPWLWCGPLSWIHHQIMLWPIFVGGLKGMHWKPWTKKHWLLIAIWILLNGMTSLFLGAELSFRAHVWGLPLVGLILLLGLPAQSSPSGRAL